VVRVIKSKEPNPSSINNDSTFTVLEDKEESPSARASEMIKDYPPDKE
jgi:hypothetical protein